MNNLKVILRNVLTSIALFCLAVVGVAFALFIAYALSLWVY